MTILVDARIKKMFFDRAHVQRAVDRGKLRTLYRTGANTRQYLRHKVLRRRRRESRPGQAPTIWTPTGFASLRNILYGVDATKYSVVVGVRKATMVTYSARMMWRTTVPGLLELGGSVKILEIHTKGDPHWRRMRQQRAVRLWEETRWRYARYRKRPYMARGFEWAKKRFPEYARMSVYASG